MKIPVQYVNDEDGNIKAIQVPISEWQKALTTLKKYKPALSLKSDLAEALEEVVQLKQKKGVKFI